MDLTMLMKIRVLVQKILMIKIILWFVQRLSCFIHYLAYIKASNCAFRRFIILKSEHCVRFFFINDDPAQLYYSDIESFDVLFYSSTHHNISPLISPSLLPVALKNKNRLILIYILITLLTNLVYSWLFNFFLIFYSSLSKVNTKNSMKYYHAVIAQNVRFFLFFSSSLDSYEKSPKCIYGLVVKNTAKKIAVSLAITGLEVSPSKIKIDYILINILIAHLINLVYSWFSIQRSTFLKW